MLASTAAILVLIAVAWAGETNPSSKPAKTEFSAVRFKDHVRYLASDKLKGRGNGSPELDAAAVYIAKQFQKAELEPVGDGGTYLQRFKMTVGAKLTGENSLVFRNGSTESTAALEKEYVPISFSATGTFDAPLVFAGYGITALDFHYDDYQGLDVKDKIVIVLRHEPQEDDEKSVFSASTTRLTPRSSTRRLTHETAAPPE